MKSPPPTVLVADDQSDVIEALKLLLEPEGFEVSAASSPAEVLATAREHELDAVLMDLNYTRDTTSGNEGLELLPRLAELDPTLPLVVMTAWGSVELAVEAMRRGARDFVQKPWDNERLLTIMRTQVELARALRRGNRLEAENRLLRGSEDERLVALDPAMSPVLELIERVGPSDANVLVTGENGTGKGVVARALHAVSLRADQPLVTVNAGGISETIFESELFGHVRGAFTDAKSDRVGRFEMADGGTLLLDEVANLPLQQQAKLLRVLESGELERVGDSRTRSVDVRILSATNSRLDEEVAAGRFRKDLLFRLRTVEIPLPPLRRRREDIEPLAELFLARHRSKYRKSISGFAPAALVALRAHPWPGNVRELDHAVERGILMARGDAIEVPDLGLVGSVPTGADLEGMTLDEVELHLVQRALERFDGNVSQAAEALGLSRSAMYRRLEKHDLGE